MPAPEVKFEGQESVGRKPEQANACAGVCFQDCHTWKKARKEKIPRPKRTLPSPACGEKSIKRRNSPFETHAFKLAYVEKSEKRRYSPLENHPFKPGMRGKKREKKKFPVGNSLFQAGMRGKEQEKKKFPARSPILRNKRRPPLLVPYHKN